MFVEPPCIMKTLKQMLRSHPHADLQRDDAYAAVAETLTNCAQMCISCSDACLAEPVYIGALRRCMRTSLDCADVCNVTARLIVRQTETSSELVHAQLHACVLACRVCADECSQHAKAHEHCRICAEICRHGQERCNFLLGEISSSGVEEESINPTESPSLSH